MILHMKLPPKAEFVPNYKILHYSEEKTTWKCIPVYLVGDGLGELQLVTEEDIRINYYYNMEELLDNGENLLYCINTYKKKEIVAFNDESLDTIVFGWIRELDCDCDTQLNHFKTSEFAEAYNQVDKTIKSIHNLGLEGNILIDNTIASLNSFSKSILDNVMIANILKEKYCVNCIPLK